LFKKLLPLFIARENICKAVRAVMALEEGEEGKEVR